MLQYRATRRLRSSTEHVAGHPNNFCFHFPDVWENISMKWIRPNKLGINLNIKGANNTKTSNKAECKIISMKY